MLQKSADVPTCRVAQQRISFLVIKKVFAFFPKALVRVHAAAIVLEDWLRHHRRSFAIAAGGVFADVLLHHNPLRPFSQRAVAPTDFRFSPARSPTAVNPAPPS